MESMASPGIVGQKKTATRTNIRAQKHPNEMMSEKRFIRFFFSCDGGFSVFI
jgi:hypothetical protein